MTTLTQRLERARNCSASARSAHTRIYTEWHQKHSPRAHYQKRREAGEYHAWKKAQLTKQNWQCANPKCRCDFKYYNEATIDHVSPLKPDVLPIGSDSLWGYKANTIENFLLVCLSCNKRKSNRTDVNYITGW